MTEPAAGPLFDAVADDLDDLGARAVLADWFLSRGQAFGRFVQLQIARHAREWADPWRARTPSFIEHELQTPHRSRPWFGYPDSVRTVIEAGLPFTLWLPEEARFFDPLLEPRPESVLVPDVTRFVRTIRAPQRRYRLHEWQPIANGLDWSNVTHVYEVRLTALESLATLWPRVRRLGVRRKRRDRRGFEGLAAFEHLERVDVTVEAFADVDVRSLAVGHVSFDLEAPWSTDRIAQVLSSLPTAVEVCDIVYERGVLRFRRDDSGHFAAVIEPVGRVRAPDFAAIEPFERFYQRLDALADLVEAGVVAAPTDVHPGAAALVDSQRALALLRTLPGVPVYVPHDGPVAIEALPDVPELRQENWSVTPAKIGQNIWMTEELARRATELPPVLAGLFGGFGIELRLHRGGSGDIETAEISTTSQLEWLEPVASTLRRVQALGPWMGPKGVETVETWCLDHGVELVRSPDHIGA